jgi:hypothetical protein
MFVVRYMAMNLLNMMVRPTASKSGESAPVETTIA